MMSLKNSTIQQYLSMRIICNDKQLGIHKKKKLPIKVKEFIKAEKKKIEKLKGKDFEQMGVRRALVLYLKKENLNPK